jgi:hypothetical protein
MKYYYGIYHKGNLIKILEDKNDLKEEWKKYTNTNFLESYYTRRRKNHKFNINGYSFLSAKNKKDLPKNCEYEKSYSFTPEIKQDKINDIFYSFDIETSTYKVDERELSIVYLAGAKGIKFKPLEITVENYNLYTTNFIKMRDYNDINNWLITLNDYSEHKNFITIIYIHNLSYEFSFFQNISFIKNNFSNENLMSIKTRQPFKLKVKNIEFRCSYKLTSSSLKELGNSLGLPKLDDIKSYDVKLTPKSTISNEEWLYNERDCDITLLTVLNEFKKCSNLNEIKQIRTLLTSTGLTRYENKQLSPKSTQNGYSAFCRTQTKYYTTLLSNKRKFYQLLQDAFLGGFVRANRYMLFKTFKNVGSIDIASSYPTQMKHRFYPINFKICENDLYNKLLELIKYNDKYIEEKRKSNHNIFNTYNGLENWFFKTRKRPFQYYFVADIELINIKVKSFKNNNEVPLISLHKTINNDSNKLDKYFKVDNGRIIQSHYLRLTVTNIDLFLISLFYDFEIKNCKALIYTNEAQKLNNYVLNSIDFYAEQKVIFKDLLKKTSTNLPTKKDFYSKRFNKYILEENILNQYETFSSEEKIEFISKQLALSKARLNAQYGINVQSPLPPKITYNINTNEWKQEEQNYVTPRTLLRNYSDGVFIVAYARLHLMIMTYLIMIHTNSTVLYWDTDSIKYVNDNDKVLDYVTYFNKCLSFIWCTEKNFNFGLFDFEGTYDYFSTGGSKSYIALKNNNIIITISGVPKRTGKYYTKLFNEECNNNFYKLVDNYYHPNTIITSEVTKKLSMGYYTGNDNYFENCELIDDYGKKYNFTGYGGTVLCDSNFTIYGITSLLDIMKYNNMCKITNNKPNHKITIIGTINKLDTKLKSEWAIDHSII